MKLVSQCTSIFPGALLLSLLNICSSVAAAADIDFKNEIAPIFRSHCIDCHGADEQESGLRLDQRASLLRGGDLGVPSIVPGKPDESYLIDVVSSGKPAGATSGDTRMPPEGPPLSDTEIALLKSWISQGAHWPGQMQSSVNREKSDHWAFQPIKKYDPPHVAWLVGDDYNPIDQFIAAKLDEAGLPMQPPADRIDLLRRVSLDLTGLPPTPEDVESFLNAGSSDDDELQRVVDRLLASKHYGERWAQHWIDVIRWAETVGFETNLERKEAWHYRDWLIRALNNDLSYDQFIRRQLAGDTVDSDSNQPDAALGFLTAGPANLPGQIGRDEMAMRQARQDELDEVIKTVSQSLFGLTIGCARCHNHKFDPITQKDYYSLQAVFGGLSYGTRRLRGKQNDEWAARVPDAADRVTQIEQDVEQFASSWKLDPPLDRVHTDRFSPETVSAVRMKIHATQNGSPASLWELEVWEQARSGQPAKNVGLATEGAVSSASSFALANQTRHHENINDGQIDRRQAFGWTAAKGGPAWVQIDLKSASTIDRITWHEGYSVPVDYELEVLQADTGQWKRVADTRRRLLRVDDTRIGDAVRIDGLDKAAVERLVGLLAQLRTARSELARLKAGPQAYAASFSRNPEPTFLLVRGDAMRRKMTVNPSVPEFLESCISAARSRSTHADSGESESSESGEIFSYAGVDWSTTSERERRLMLVEHLTRPDHPLTSRVIVNRIWQHHFGTGLVETPSDFGSMGARPSHPRLLDWLSSQFIENGWSLKWLHRIIVTSRTYRQSSFPVKQALATDAECRLLWRFPPRRLEAEAIRDSILCVSGKLNTRMYGPGFDLFNQRGGLSDYQPKETFDESGWRRMIYAHKIRMQSVDVFGEFDCPDAGQLQPSRPRSITPVQALSLFNSPFVNRQAEFFAQRVNEELSEEADTGTKVQKCFNLALARKPTAVEQEVMVELASEAGLVAVCRVLFNSSEFLYLR